MILNNDKHLLHRLIVTCLDSEKIMAHTLKGYLNVHVEMSIIKEVKSPQDFKDIFGSFMGACDIIVALMTDKSKATISALLAQNENTIRKRALVVIPVLMGRVDIGFGFFSTFPIISNTGNINDLSDKLSKVINGYLSINLSSLSVFDFENLAKDVLIAYDFHNIMYSYSDHFDFGYDMMCSYSRTGGLGEVREDWLVEVKFASKERFTIRNIESLIMKDRFRYLPNHKVMLITNGTLTSVIWDYVADLQKKQNLPIHIVDGWKLCNLIAFKDNLVKSYFPYE